MNSDILCRRTHRLLRWVLLLICALGFISSVRRAWQSPIWAPRNEMAHYDAIDRGASLSIPRPDDPITDYTFRITRQHFVWKEQRSFNGARESMGPDAYSYEAQQPCLYYGLMAIPNAVLKAVGTAPPTQIRLLRLLQQLSVILGTLLLIPIFRELETHAGISSLNGCLLAAWMALGNAWRYPSLGNDALSPLFCNLGIYLALLGMRKKSFPLLVGAAVGAGAAFLIKYTNVLLPALYALFALTLVRKRTGWDPRRIVLLALIPCLLPAGQILLNLLVSGHLVQASALEDLFNTVGSVRGGAWRFLRILLMDSVMLRQAPFDLPLSLPRYLMALLAMNTLLSGVRVVRNRRWDADAFLLTCCMVTLTLLGAAVVLNTVRPGVWWMAFRHYAGYQVFYFLALFSIPFPMNTAWRTGLQAAATVLLLWLAV